MARVTIHIPSVSWRDGRPRYAPGPETRRRYGVRAQDLKRPDGTWMSAEEAAAWVAAMKADLAGAAAARRPRQALAKARAGHAAAGPTVEALAEAFLASPRMTGSKAGRRAETPKAPATRAFYRQKLAALGRFDPEIWGGPAASLTRPICAALYERLWEARGLATARAVMASLSVVLAWAIRAGRLALPVNPAQGLAMATPEPRLRAGTPAEIAQLMAAADLIGLPEIGDCIWLGVWTGQRQADRLAMTGQHLAGGRLVVRQGKTAARVDFPVAPQLEARLAAGRARRAGWQVQPALLVVREAEPDREGRRRGYDRFAYAKAFARVREAAVAGIVRDGRQLLAPMASLAGFRDQDLRDTCVTWLARAGCDPILISRITGHALASVHQVLRHYLVAHPEQGDRAIATMAGWFDQQAG